LHPTARALNELTDLAHGPRCLDAERRLVGLDHPDDLGIPPSSAVSGVDEFLAPLSREGISYRVESVPGTRIRFRR
jgi:hypothetical protein